jgi:hypothetical protein
VILFAISKCIIQVYIGGFYRKESKCGVSGLGSLEMRWIIDLSQSRNRIQNQGSLVISNLFFSALRPGLKLTDQLYRGLDRHVEKVGGCERELQRLF